MPGKKKSAAKKLLSICIPTYNRADKLDRMLGGIRSQIGGLEDIIEICISDNGSVDGTHKVISKWKKSLPIISGRNRTNMGFDFNLIAVLKIAHGEYCWFFGDDDEALEGGIARVVSDIESLGGRKVGAIYVNILHKSRVNFCDLPDAGFKHYLLDESGIPGINLLSMDCMCVHRETVLGIIKNGIRMEGRQLTKAGKDPIVLQYFTQVYLFLECAKKTGSFAIEPTPAIRLLEDGESWVSYPRKIFLEAILYKYIYDIKAHYGWFNAPLAYNPMKSYLLRVALVSEQPRLEAAFGTANAYLLKVLRFDHRRFEMMAIFLVEAIRKLPLMPCIISFSYRTFLRLRGRGNIIMDMDEPNQEILYNLELLAKHANA